MGVFETNSSSTHAFCMCTKADYVRWCDNDKSIVFDPSCRRLMSVQEAKEKEILSREERYPYHPEFTKRLKELEGDELYSYLTEEVDFYNYDRYQDREDEEATEVYYDEFVTPSGETVVLFGYEGYDG